MEPKHYLILAIFAGWLLFIVLREANKQQPVLIKRDHYEILMKLRYLEHEMYADALTNSRSKQRYNYQELLALLPQSYHKYIDTQDYINGTKVIHIPFEIY